MKKFIPILTLIGTLLSVLPSSCKKQGVKCEETTTWRGYYGTLNETTQENGNSFISSGVAKLTSSPYSYYWSWLALDIPSCRNIDADDLKLELRSKNPTSEGAIEELDFGVKIIGDQDSAWVYYIGRSFRQEFTYLGLGENNGVADLPELVQLFQDWTTTTLEAKNNTLSVYKNGALVKSYSYDGKKLGKLKEIHISFKGVGSVDWVRMYDNSGKLKFREEFNTDNTSTPEWQ